MPSDPPAPDILDAARHAAILERIIAERLAGLAPVETPRCFLLGGQPGAGKTGLRRAIEQALGAAKPLLIDPDELREYHPRYVALVEQDPAHAASRVHPDAARWADELREAALARRLNVIVDGTLRDPEWATGMAGQAVARGYAVEVHAVAVPFEISAQGVRERFETSAEAAASWTGEPAARPLPRNVPEDYQRAAYAGLPLSLAALSTSGLVARIRIARRDGTALIDAVGPDAVAAAGEVTPNPFAETLRQERNRPWTRAERDTYGQASERILGLMRARGADAQELAEAGARLGGTLRREETRARNAWLRRVLEYEPP
ncbi:MAG: zeta toxin family protein [Acetobacteraceae bacterium]